MKGSYGAEFGITKCHVEICPGYNAVLENAALEMLHLFTLHQIVSQEIALH